LLYKVMRPLVGKFNEHGFIAIVMYMWVLLSMQIRAKPGPPASSLINVWVLIMELCMNSYMRKTHRLRLLVLYISYRLS
jgi:hypothetical protein